MPAPPVVTAEDAVVNELHDFVATTWPEVVDESALLDGLVRGVWQGEQVEQVNFSLIRPPYAVVIVGEWTPDGGWAQDRVVESSWVELYYVGPKGRDGRSVRQKLRELRAVLAPPDGSPCPLAYSQAVDVGGITTARSLGFNQALASKKLPLRAGRLRLRLLFEEGQGMNKEYEKPPELTPEDEAALDKAWASVSVKMTPERRKELLAMTPLGKAVGK